MAAIFIPPAVLLVRSKAQDVDGDVNACLYR
jgi:hypothetical protein